MIKKTAAPINKTGIIDSSVSLDILLTNKGIDNVEKIFLDSFTRDAFSNFFKILILVSSLFVLNSSKNFKKI